MTKNADTRQEASPEEPPWKEAYLGLLGKVRDAVDYHEEKLHPQPQRLSETRPWLDALRSRLRIEIEHHKRTAAAARLEARLQSTSMQRVAILCARAVQYDLFVETLEALSQMTTGPEQASPDEEFSRGSGSARFRVGDRVRVREGSHAYEETHGIEGRVTKVSKNEDPQNDQIEVLSRHWKGWFHPSSLELIERSVDTELKVCPKCECYNFIDGSCFGCGYSNSEQKVVYRSEAERKAPCATEWCWGFGQVHRDSCVDAAEAAAHHVGDCVKDCSLCAEQEERKKR